MYQQYPGTGFFHISSGAWQVCPRHVDRKSPHLLPPFSVSLYFKFTGHCPQIAKGVQLPKDSFWKCQQASICSQHSVLKVWPQAFCSLTYCSTPATLRKSTHKCLSSWSATEGEFLPKRRVRNNITPFDAEQQNIFRKCEALENENLQPNPNHHTGPQAKQC